MTAFFVLLIPTWPEQLPPAKTYFAVIVLEVVPALLFTVMFCGFVVFDLWAEGAIDQP